MGKCIIIYADSKGGVKTVSETLHKSFKSNSIEIDLWNMNDHSSNLLGKIFKSLNESWKISREEVFILQHFDAIFLGLFLRLFGFRRLINVVHIDLVSYYESVGYLKKAVIRLMFFLIKNKKIVFVSKEAELKAQQFFKLRNTNTIYNLYDFDFLEKNMIEDKKKITLGSISRLHTVKNVDLIIRLIKELNKKNENIDVLIYGDGDQYNNLKNYIYKLGCENFIKMMGVCNDKNEMYNSIDALISLSSIEGLPTVILESIAFGKPVLYTDCSSGPRELMAPSTNPLNKTNSYEKTNVGYLVKPVLDVASYSNSLSSYEQEYVGILESFISDVGKQNFSMEYDASPFSEEVVVKKWLEMIGQLN